MSQTSTDLRSEISSILGPEKELVLTEKMHHIVSNFRNRATSVRQKLEQTVSLEIEDTEDDTDDEDYHGFTAGGAEKSVVEDDNQEAQSDSKGLIEKLMEWV